MVAVAKVQTHGLERRLRELERRAPSAALQTAVSGADHFVGFMDSFAPRDTGRYVRGWIQAGNMLPGVPQRRLPVLTQSRWRDRFERSINEQIERLVRKLERVHGLQDAWYHSKGRKPDKHYRKLQREADNTSRRLIRAVQQKKKFLNADAPVIVMDLFSGGRTVRGKNGKLRRLRLTTVRDKVYGGTAAVVEALGEERVVLRNLEPHASIVEHRHRMVARARGATRAYTDANARRIFMRALSGRTVTSGSLG